MKYIALCFALVLSNAAFADDLFREDGVANVVRSFAYRGKTYERVQLGNRTPNGIEVYHKKGILLCNEADLPTLWVKALAKREAGKLTPATQDGKKPATTEQAAVANKYREAMAKALMSATIHLTRPLALYDIKADGTSFEGTLVAMKDSELLIADGKTVAWVPDSYFKAGKEIRESVKINNSPELHAAARSRAEAVARKGALKKWPDNFNMQDYEIGLQMKAWDKLNPAPVKPNAAGESKELPLDPFAE